MRTVSTSLSLIREDDQFCAGIAMIRGDLESLKNQSSWLHPEELKVYDQYQYDKRKRSYLLGRYSAKQAITTLCGLIDFDSIYIDSGVFNFPIVKGTSVQNIQVSISHCDHLGISIAFPDAHPMGVDIEAANKDRLEVVQSQLTVAEMESLRSLNLDLLGSFILFSMKESLSKVLKTGMMLDFRILEVTSLHNDNSWLEAEFVNFSQYKAIAFHMAGYVCSLVIPKKTNIPDEDMQGLLEKWRRELLDSV